MADKSIDVKFESVAIRVKYWEAEIKSESKVEFSTKTVMLSGELNKLSVPIIPSKFVSIIVNT